LCELLQDESQVRGKGFFRSAVIERSWFEPCPAWRAAVAPSRMGIPGM